ncbi:MAG: LPS assembly protein LptD [Gammaproteobacteria bacterium]|nr:LPS assembly protein LptD [Gammaproteobacteria bacterium]
MITHKKSASLVFYSRAICGLGLLFYSSAIFSQDSNSCPVIDESVVHRPPPLFSADEIGRINISADSTRSDREGNSTFIGNVVIEKHELRVTADSASYNPSAEDIRIDGNVHVDTINMALNAELGLLSIEEKSILFRDVEFVLSNNNMRGKAARISAEQETTTELQQTLITSCSLTNPDWRLNADDIVLNHEEEYGSANDVVLRFMEVPFIYVPYMQFPIGDRRRSGLLFPEIGYSSSRGTEFTVPWYWNIAPNQDAIIAPHPMSRRGTQLDTQYRFLTENSRGQMDVAFLHNDKVTDESRHQFQYRQHTRFSPDLNMDVDIQDVSDTDYFNDFSSNLSTTSTTHLNRNLLLNYSQPNWQARLLAQTFETLDTTILPAGRPYRRLPQLTLRGDQPIGRTGLVFTLDSEWVDFDHEEDSVVTGSRFQIKPGLRWLNEGAYWFVKPAIKFSHTQYEVEDGSGVIQSVEDRNLPMSSLDAGLFFERDLDSGLIQTLEPRIYYLNVPYSDQSLLPDFDTQASIFSTALLFRDNRFNGGDRIGDANQLTLALSSRLINPETGKEYFRASLGQIQYFEDRKVSLTGTVETDSTSDLMAEVAAYVKDWSLSASTQWNTDNNYSQRGNFLARYQSDEKHIFNIGLRNDRSISPEIRQTDMSFMVPINNDFSAFGRWNYSLERDRNIDIIGGFSYDSCCWSIQLMGQRRLIYNNAVEEYDNAIMVQLVLKGLGSVSGSKVDNTLKQAILGYKEDYE